MKKIFFTIAMVFSFISHAQKLEWIPFDWNGSNLAGKYYDKSSIVIPVTLNNLPYKFNMQFDLGATETMIYGNSIKPYLEKHIDFKNKIDSTLIFRMENKINYMFKNLEIKLGNVDFGKRNIGHFYNFGKYYSVESMVNNEVKHIGTIAPDLFKDKVLIIDYPNKRICITTKIPKKFKKASFLPYKEKNGRIMIPLTIDNKQEYLMFDTGSSLFALFTTKDKANEISNDKIVDSIKTSTWGEHYFVYGKSLKTDVKFGDKVLDKNNVYYDPKNRFANLFKEEEIWGLTGNAYFFNNILIIDYKNKLFGVQ